MDALHICKHCHAPLPADAPRGICPNCILAAERGAPTDPAATVPAMAGSAGLPNRLNQPPGTMPVLGQRFGGYQIIRLLGQGGMGAVFEAEELESGRRVALKVLSHSLDSADARKRFLREGRLAASINHPNSVYVFGTEEIEGTPAIVMELVAGGTLQERVKQHGPLPVSEAVEIILQIIAGLEAAAAVGVLHRDIKPSNCFIDSDGSVKVGDFGLSIDTSARGDSNLTLSGVFLGTPVFSPPEQLRGDELSLHSDIYAVGGTFYYLLTGRTPFEGDNLVKLLATVLERSAESPQKWRKEIPAELGAVTLRCLEKQPAKRFEDYAELARALAPFDSTPPQPANLGLRFLAGGIDYITIQLLSLVFGAIYAAVHHPRMDAGLTELVYSTPFRTIASALAILLLALPEGLAGGTLGKLSCRLRVAGSDRNRIGVPRALLRAALFVLVQQIPFFAFRIIYPSNLTHPDQKFQLTEEILSSVFLALLFVTARKMNQFAAVHDLLSGSRVVVQRGRQTRIPTATPAEPPAPADATIRIGPYYLLEPLPATVSGQVVSGTDPRLKRRVWIRWLPPGTPPLDEYRRALRRPGRMRWLNGKRTADECWDAFAAAPGRPLLELLDHRHSWTVVRGWLLDLGEELAAAEKDRSQPAQLSLDRVWITNDGRARLLDFPVPRFESREVEPAACRSERNLASQAFLNHVALAALEGRIPSLDEARSRVVQVPVPLGARTLLQALPKLTDLSALTHDLRALLRQAGEVTQHTRQVSGLTGWLFLCLALFMAFSIGASANHSWFVQPRCVKFLRHALDRIEEIQRAPQPVETRLAEEKKAYEICIAHRLDWLVRTESIWSDSQVQKALTPEQRRLAELIVAEPKRASAAEQNRAIARFHPLLNELGLSPSDKWDQKFRFKLRWTPLIGQLGRES